MSNTLNKNTPKPQSGYTPCACRDCMDTTVSSDIRSPELCEACTDAQCSRWRIGQEADGPASWIFDCQRDDAHGDSVGDAGTGHGAYEYRSGA